MNETVLDARALTCPMPVLRANRALRSMQPGDTLRVLATDQASVADFRVFCRETGHVLVSLTDTDGVLHFTIRRRSAPDTAS